MSASEREYDLIYLFILISAFQGVVTWGLIMVYVFRLARMSNLRPRAHKIARSKSGTHVFDCCHGTEKKGKVK